MANLARLSSLSPSPILHLYSSHPSPPPSSHLPHCLCLHSLTALELAASLGLHRAVALLVAHGAAGGQHRCIWQRYCRLWPDSAASAPLAPLRAVHYGLAWEALLQQLFPTIPDPTRDASSGDGDGAEEGAVRLASSSGGWRHTANGAFDALLHAASTPGRAVLWSDAGLGAVVADGTLAQPGLVSAMHALEAVLFGDAAGRCMDVAAVDGHLLCLWQLPHTSSTSSTDASSVLDWTLEDAVGGQQDLADDGAATGPILFESSSLARALIMAMLAPPAHLRQEDVLLVPASGDKTYTLLCPGLDGAALWLGQAQSQSASESESGAKDCCLLNMQEMDLPLAACVRAVLARAELEASEVWGKLGEGVDMHLSDSVKWQPGSSVAERWYIKVYAGDLSYS